MCSKAKTRVRITAALAAAVLTVALPTGLPPMTASAASLSDMQRESANLKAEADRLQREIAAQESVLNDKTAYVNSLNLKIQNAEKQVALYASQINSLNDNIAALNQTIAAKESEIEQKEADIADRFQQLRQRLRAISKNGNLSTFQMLMDTDNYTEYLIKSKMMERVAANDQRLMEEMEKEIQAIDEQRTALSKDKDTVADQLAAVEQLKKDADVQKREIELLCAKATAAQQEAKDALDDSKAELRNTKADWDRLENQIAKIIESQSTSTGKYGGGTMAWPVPAVRNLSDVYGPRWGTMHRGVDIANGSVPIYGQNIVAAESGVVIYANSTNSWGGGYGYHVIIDHGLDSSGRRISTLYAHMSAVNVRVGQQVTRGTTVLGQAGRTGDVTGPHLHFEVRVNGTAVDPIKNGYLKVN